MSNMKQLNAIETHPAYEAWVAFRKSQGYPTRINAWYAGWLAFVAGWEAATKD